MRTGRPDDRWPAHGERCRVLVALPEGEAAAGASEELDAVAQDRGLFLVTSTPLHVHGLAVGDLARGVRVTGEGDAIWLQEVHTPGEHWNARLDPLREGAAGRAERVLGPLGCVVTETRGGRVTVDVPPECDGAAVEAQLDEGEGVWWASDRGVAPPWRQVLPQA